MAVNKEQVFSLIEELKKSIFENNEKLNKLDDLLDEIIEVDKNMTIEIAQKVKSLGSLLWDTQSDYDYYSDIFENVEETKIEVEKEEKKSFFDWKTIFFIICILWIILYYNWYFNIFLEFIKWKFNF